MGLDAIDPVLIRLGPLAIRWYGVLMAASVAIGFYYFRRDGLKLGYPEDFLYNAAFLALVGGIVGARAVYVVTNWPVYAGDWVSMLRIDQGGLSFHGGIIGGALAGGAYAARKRCSFEELADLAVPGIAVGVMLVRLANLINQEVMGRTVEAALGFERWPAQLIGSAIGLVLLVINARLARRRPPVGYLFWSFVIYYSLLRGFVEETVRENPLYLPVVESHVWGIGLFTLTQLVTPLFLLLGWAMRRRAVRLGRRPMGPLVRSGRVRR